MSYMRAWQLCRTAAFCLLLSMKAAALHGPAITPSHSPLVYLPDNCDTMELSGLRKVSIASQGDSFYQANRDCTVVLSVRDGYRMRISFDHLDLPHPVRDWCQDAVEFFDGHTKHDSLLSPICGTQLPESFVSNSSQVSLLFRTDDRDHRSGFRIRAERLKPHPESASSTDEVDTEDRSACSKLDRHTCDNRTATRNSSYLAAYIMALSAVGLLGGLVVVIAARFRGSTSGRMSEGDIM